jgi:hypothetical protein
MAHLAELRPGDNGVPLSFRPLLAGLIISAAIGGDAEVRDRRTIGQEPHLRVFPKKAHQLNTV